MKRPDVPIVLGGIACMLLISFNPGRKTGAEIPENVETILKTSCFDCHSNMSRNDKPKDALNFDKWEDYSLTKKISRLDKLVEVMEESKMPPGKYLNAHPEKKLTDDQRKLLIDWAEKESDMLMGGADE